MPQGTEAIVTARPKSYTGGCYIGDLGITLPVPGPDAFAPLDPGFDPSGYIGPDGFTKNVEHSDEDEFAWGGVVVNTVRTETSITYSTVFRETANPVTLRRLFGEANVIEDTVNGVLTVLTDESMAPRQSVVFEMLDNGRGHREVLENAQILAGGEQTFSHGASVTIPATIKVYPGTTEINGKTPAAWNMKQIDTAPVVP